MFVHIEFQISALIVFGVCVFMMIYRKGIQNLQNKSFIAIVIFGILSTIFEIGSVIGDFNGTISVAKKDFFNTGYHICHSTTMFLLLFYAFTISGRYHVLNSRRIALLFTPLALLFTAMLLNPVLRWAFRYDEYGRYIRGPLIYVEYLISFFYFCMMMYLLIKYRNSSNSERSKGLVIIMLIAAAGVIVQMIWPEILIELFTQSIGTITALLLVENEHDIFDYNSGTRNEAAFFNDNVTLLSADVKYSIVSVSFLNYKRVYSAVGSTIVREILGDIAVKMKNIFKPNTVYYCNNGTFAVTYFGEDREHDITRDIDNLRGRFEHTYIYKDFGIIFTIRVIKLDITEDVDNIDDLTMIIENSFVASNTAFKVLNSNELSLIKRNININKSVKKAIKTNAFEVHYQPIWDTRIHRIRSAEALVRMYDDEMGYVSPEEFIRLAEENGTVDNIGEFTFETVCNDFNRYGFRELGIDFIEVNLSTVQCMKTELSDTFREIIDKYSISPHEINLEITETAAIENRSLFEKSMSDLSDIGFKFSLDDYGTGHSNIEYVLDMDFSIVKIDKSILWNASPGSTARSILDHTISMFRESGLEIVCEGVETEDQLAHLIEMGVEYCQGYYFSKPVDADTFVDLCRKYNL